jgi:hypothetical protein
MKKKNKPYDIIGDIHGHADTLRVLLAKLSYVERDGAYRHPDRTVIFVGDFIDRGPKIRETLQIVRAMVDAGTARAVLGNHEWNALRYHTLDEHGKPLRLNNTKNEGQHRATLDQLVHRHPDEWANWLQWFKTLPLFLDLGGLRVVHAAWCPRGVKEIGGRCFADDDLLHMTAHPHQPGHEAVKILLTGPELDLPEGAKFIDPKGHEHRDIRVRWLGTREHDKPQTFRSLVFPPSDTVPDIAVEERLLARMPAYADTEPPVFCGHYWLPPAEPAPLAPNVVCVDYSVAKEGGMLVAYRWHSEAVLDGGKYVYVSRVDPTSNNSVLIPPPRDSTETGFRVLVDDNYHFMDEDERYTLGDFATHEEALAACKQIVDDFLLSNHQPGMTAASLCSGYTGFGEDPWIAHEGGYAHFSAWDYAKRRCDEMCRDEVGNTGGQLLAYRSEGEQGLKAEQSVAVPRQDPDEPNPIARPDAI